MFGPMSLACRDRIGRLNRSRPRGRLQRACHLAARIGRVSSDRRPGSQATRASLSLHDAPAGFHRALGSDDPPTPLQLEPLPRRLRCPSQRPQRGCSGPCSGLGPELLPDDVECKPASRHPWAWLLSRVFAADVMTCPRCRGAMRLVKLARLLAELGLGPRPPPRPRPKHPRRHSDPEPARRSRTAGWA